MNVILTKSSSVCEMAEDLRLARIEENLEEARDRLEILLSSLMRLSISSSS